MKIYAKTGSDALLINGIIPEIGQTSENKRYKKDGTCELQIRVVFHFGNNDPSDVFLFENDNLVFHSISTHRGTFITNTYQELIRLNEVSPEALISVITETFTLNQLGF